jgi:CSLREA domain-containing protein
VAGFTLLSLLFAAPAQAGTITVTTSFDELAGGDGLCSLREAVNTANADANSGGCKDANPAQPDVIKLAGGDYHLSIPGFDDANASGDLDVTESVTIRGLGAEDTGIDANGTATGDRAIQAHNTGTVLTLAGLTVHDGAAGNQSGGGISAATGTVLTLTDSDVTDNTAVSGGGISADAVKLTNSAVSDNGTSIGNGGGIVAVKSARLTGSTVNGNSAGNAGGGMWAVRAILVRSTVSGNSTGTVVGAGGGGIEAPTVAKLTRSTVSDNTAHDPGGGISGDRVDLTDSNVRDNRDDSDAGGIYAGTAANLIRSSVSGNHANGANGEGGGIFSTGANLDGSTVFGNTAGRAGGGLAGGGALVNSALIGNRANGTASPSGGGGVFAIAPTTLTSTTVSRNRSAKEGGGLYGDLASGSLTLSRSTVAGNRATANGGGIFFTPLTAATLNVVNSTLSGNETDQWGGALSTNKGTTTLSSDTINRNLADADSNGTGDGGGLDVFGTAAVTPRNTILAGNLDTGGEKPDWNCGGGVASQGYNLIGSGVGCAASTTTGDELGSNATLLNASLSLLADNGGPTLTSALHANSPAINKGNPATPGSGGNACPATDQRGVPRSLGGRCDRGAYERVSCHGKLVNVVGTNGPNHLVGTSGNDGILGLGGADTLSGRSGNDGLCGGSGNDHLFGGAGKDFLDDGPGTDSCDGGPGIDSSSGCETKVSIP